MEFDNQLDELLFRYLANEVNNEERKFVEDWIGDAEENHRHFENLKNIWQLSSLKHTLDYVLDEMNVHEKWEHFRQTAAEKEALKQRQYGGEPVQQEIPVQKPGIGRFLVRAAIAASLVLMVVFGWKLMVPTRHETIVVQNTSRETDQPVVVARREENTSGKEKRIQLPDGSLVVLADKSAITFSEPFRGKRDIYLVGKAYFKVTKDTTKPFTVVCDDVSTTALGTEFTVTAFRKDKKIIVRLYEGKVVIKAGRRIPNDVYLRPGQEFIYDRQPATKLKSFKLKEPAAPEEILDEEWLRDNPAIPDDDKGSWFMFNNQQLGEVLEQFAVLYNVQIVYNKVDVKNIYFTGKFNRLDSLEMILKRIGTVNNFKITKKDAAFILSK